jgi:glycosyltransferase involved in cell wall biosynthesis
MTELMVVNRVAPRTKFTTIYSGLEIEPFLAAGQVRDKSRRALGFAPEELVIGTIARLSPLKGHEFLVRAAPSIVAAWPQARFLLVGDGPLRERITSQVAAAGLSDRFKFVGLVAPERIPALIAAMDVVVHVSLREGLARVLVQSLLVGRPVISYDVDGAREVVLDGETGFLLAPKSIDELVGAVGRLAADSELPARMGSTGRRLFADRFRHERMVDDLHRLYERLLARPVTEPSSVVAPGAAD